ncbi:MAG: UvrD-helicase domain-containing protein [Treponema sp.]|jgi:DNA helicase-2/ATP-dependent DNA helicase PcrA|nr:UvrD-helicase domain-containing protein [Treponema sp.]
MQSDNYLNVLNPEQCQAVMHEGSPLLILAGAGSGKTRVITTKIAWLIEQGTDPRSILAVTFTKKAANEMRERACRLNEQAQFAQIRTFHSFGSWFLRIYAEYAGLAPNFTIYDDDDMLTLLSKTSPELTHNQCAHYVRLISRAKDYCLLPESENLSQIDEDLCFADYYQKYEERLRETGNVDFGDLISLPIKVLKENPEIQAQVHHRFRVIMIDEYQDSNVAQFELLKILAGAETYVCVVGDDDQSIYSFRGAEVQNILTFQENFKGAELIKLERNYRSVASVLKIADEVVKNNKDRLGKTLIAERSGGKKPVAVFLSNQDDETAFCAEIIKAAYAKGCPYSDWAVLYRTNAQSLSLETEFINKKIPYKVVGSLKFYDREEIKDVIAYLSLVLNPRDEVSFSRVVNKPLRSIGNSSQQKIIEFARSTYGTIEILPENRVVLKGSILEACSDNALSLPAKAKKGLQSFLEIMNALISELKNNESDEAAVSKEIYDIAQAAVEEQLLSNVPFEKEKTLASFIEKVISTSGLGDFHSTKDEIAGTQRLNNMQELANSAVLYPKTKAGLALFFDHIELDRAVTQAEDSSDAVTLITLHNTKGLEFPRVIITGIEKGIFPREDKKGSELEEERRLFYVGITRTRDELYLTTTSSRRLYGRVEWMSPSPFLAEINRNSIDVLGRKPARFYFADEKQQKNSSKYISTSEKTEHDLLYEHWKPGTKIYHDDFGYGLVCKAFYIKSDFAIFAAFESGIKKQFIPEHCKSTLMRIKN